MLKKTLVSLIMLLVFGSTVFCSLGSSGESEAELVASIPTKAEPIPKTVEVVEDQTIVSTPTPVPPPTPTLEPAEAAPTALTAQEAYELALAEARVWQADAALVSLGTSLLGPLDAEGTSEGWSLSFWSPSTNEMLTLPFINGTLNAPPAVQLPADPGTIPAFDSVILEMKGIYETAAEAGGSKYLDQGFYAMAGLTPYPLDENIPTWYINYHNGENNTVAFTVIIDARSGEVIQAIDVGAAAGE